MDTVQLFVLDLAKCEPKAVLVKYIVLLGSCTEVSHIIIFMCMHSFWSTFQSIHLLLMHLSKVYAPPGKPGTDVGKRREICC